MKTTDAYFVSKYCMSTSCLPANWTCVSIKEKYKEVLISWDYSIHEWEAF